MLFLTGLILFVTLFSVHEDYINTGIKNQIVFYLLTLLIIVNIILDMLTIIIYT